MRLNEVSAPCKFTRHLLPSVTYIPTEPFMFLLTELYVILKSSRVKLYDGRKTLVENE